MQSSDLGRLPDIKKGAMITRRLFNEDKIYDIDLYYKHYFYTQQKEMDYNIDGGSIYDLLSSNKQGQGEIIDHILSKKTKTTQNWLI